MLVYNPDKRITAEASLNHRYFTTEPLPSPIGTLPAHLEEDLAKPAPDY